ncbi:MAG: DUF5666 domain-containing protein [Pseudomonadota bacterium]
MTKVDRRTVLSALGASTLAGCAGPLQIGEGKRDPQGGIGGTGIVGTLTDFGSVIVNGLRVELDGGTQLTGAFGSVSETALALGQSLTIEAATDQDRLVARRIHLTHPVIGRVTGGGRSDGVAFVEGVRVRPEPGMLGSLNAGKRVAVSGVWQGGEVVASRVDQLDDLGASALAGVVGRAPDGSGPTVGPVAIAMDSSLLPPVGSFVTLVWRGGGIGAYPSRIVPNRFVGAAGPLTALSVEGFLDPVPQAPSFTVAGLGHSFDDGAVLGAFRDLRALFSGPYDGTFNVAEGLPLPDDFDARREVSRTLLAGGARRGLPVR